MMVAEMMPVAVYNFGALISGVIALGSLVLGYYLGRATERQQQNPDLHKMGH